MERDFRKKVEARLSSNYVGEEDDMLQFTGDKKAHVFTQTIKNNGLTGITVALIGGYYTDKSQILNNDGSAIDGLITDTIADVVISGNPKPVFDFAEFIRRAPSRVRQLKMLVNDAAQFENPLKVRKLSPFTNLGDEAIYPSNFKLSNQFDDKRVEIATPDLQIDSQTVVLLDINAGASVTITWFIDRVLNDAAALKTKTDRLMAARRYDQ